MLGVSLEKTTPGFRFRMRIAMLRGFVTACPVNWWLIRVGLKEKMQARARAASGPAPVAPAPEI